MFLQAHEGVAPFRIVLGKAGAGDRDQAAARCKAREGGRKMTPCGVGHAAFDMNARREWRVHHHDGRLDGTVEIVVDMGGVVLCHRRPRKQLLQERVANGGIFVEGEARMGKLGEDREQAGPGRRFEHEIAGHYPGGAGRDIGERHRRGELLERLAFFGASRVGGYELCHPVQHRQRRLRGIRAGCDRRTEFAQEQDLRNFRRLIGVLPHPEAFGVAAAEGLIHTCAEIGSTYGLAAFKERQERVTGAKNVAAAAGAVGRYKGGGGRICGRSRNDVHGETCRERGRTGLPERSPTPAGHPFPAPLSLYRRAFAEHPFAHGDHKTCRSAVRSPGSP